MTNHVQRNLNEMNSGLPIRDNEVQKPVRWYIQSKNCQPRITDTGKLSFKNESEIKIFPHEQKLRESVDSRSDLQKLLKRFLQAERKWTQAVIWIHMKK